MSATRTSSPATRTDAAAAPDATQASAGASAGSDPFKAAPGPNAAPIADAAAIPTVASIPQAPPIPNAAPIPQVGPFPAAAPFPAGAPVPEPTAPALEPPPGGWYPASTGYPGGPRDYRPAAGTLAAPGRTGGGTGGGPQRRGRVGLSPPFSKRGPLVNVLLFGLAPVLLAGLVIGAFVLVAPGKPAASSHTSGFRAGPAISAHQAADAADPTPAATSSPAKRAKANPSASTRAGKRASMPSGITSSARASAGAGTGTGAKSTKGTKSTKKKRRATVTPHNLGPPNFDGYCQHLGLGTAKATANNAYGWRCTGNIALVVVVQDVCVWTYGLNIAQVVNITTDYNSADAWQCWRINRYLGQLDVASYCSAAGLGTATLKATNADGWYCGSQPVDFQAGCQLMYHSSDAIARFEVYADPYSWQCWD